MSESEQNDYFVASFVNGTLEVEPYCRCGTQLDEEYVCSACGRHCLPTVFRCTNQATLDYVKKTVLAHPRFKRFKAVLTG